METEKTAETPVKKRRGRPRTLPGTVTVKDVVKTVLEAGGNVHDTIKVLGLSAADFYKRFRYHPKVEEALRQAREIGFESVTDTLYAQALQGNLKACSLYLKYNPLAKQHGWVDNQTVTIKDEKPLSPEEKQRLAKELFG